MSTPTLHTYGPSNVDETLTTTLVNLRPQVRDNIFKQNPALRYMMGRGRVTVRGGASISHGVLYGTNSTAQSYSRYGLLDVTPQDGLTRDQWPWAQYAVSISIDGFTERTNVGEQELIDALDVKRMQAEESLSLLLEQDIFGNTNSSEDIVPLETIVSASGTCGDINGTTNTWWQSQTKSSGSWAGQGRADLENLVNTVSIQNPAGLPDVLISDQNTFEYYKGSLAPHLRFEDNATADIGIRNITFNGIPWFWSPQATASTIYALKDRAIEFYVHANTDFKITPFTKPYNQDARTAQVLLQCALVTGNRRKLGLMNGISA